MATAPSLPRPRGPTFVTDGGLETTLIFHDGVDLPEFAAFVLLDRPGGTDALRRYYSACVDIAREQSVGIVLDTPTWRANPDWCERLGYSLDALADVNRRSVALLEEIRAGTDLPFLISGCIGPRGDGYVIEEAMSADETEAYHGSQVGVFADAEVDLVTALTLTSAEEAIGVTRAARKADVPAVISFTIEVDGRLPSGRRLDEAIAQVDRETSEGPAYFMVQLSASAGSQQPCGLVARSWRLWN